MKLVLFLHLLFVGAWLGCILTEAIYEHMIDNSDAQRSLIAAIHDRTDRLIEIPAFLGVFVTGSIMLPWTTMSPLFLTKVVFGLLAMVSNGICVWLVVRRKRAVDLKRFEDFEALHRRQHMYGAVVLIAFLIALGIGSYYFVV